MRIGVFGTGEVGRTLATAWHRAGHEVALGSRSATHPAAVAWVEASGDRASTATFASVAAASEVIVNATAGAHSPEVLGSTNEDHTAGKVLIDVSNPLDFSAGFPPSLTVANTDSLAETLQRTHPRARVVKTLNTVHHSVMVDPDRVPGGHQLFLSGDDAEAKSLTRDLLADLGWSEDRVLDLGDLSTARGVEAYLLLWVRLYAAAGTGELNVEVRTAEAAPDTSR